MGGKLICQNRKAFHDYFIEESVQAGISLLGSEVKSLREGKVNLGDSHGDIKSGEVFLVDAHISPYSQANRLNHNPLRTRKLLLHKKEIKRLIGKVEQRGYTLIPLKLYFVEGRVKVDLALAKGKKLFDKRETLKKKTMEREMERGRKGFDGGR
ncbi:MAG TPA: SsrA-binding protein SmpB [Thermodesulfobacteriota bacterium]|jgi:SsrA-binding protein|nr:SsrA-binding protein SmpB [Thermodesulfobacteriota bacterium]